MTPKKQKSRGHTFLGEDAGRELAARLNAPGDHRAALALIEIACRATTAKPEIKKLLALKATAELAQFTFRPVVETINSFWSINWAADLSGQAEEVILVLELAENGVLHQMGRCGKADCSQWFFKIFPHQRYHSDECRIAELAADPQRKQKRKLLMRVLRKRQKQRAEIRKQLATRKRGK